MADEHGPDVPTGDIRLLSEADQAEIEKRRRGEPPERCPVTVERQYLPTFADLVDRLTIVQLKEIFIPEHAAEYRHERGLIQHDLDVFHLGGGATFDAECLRLVCLLMLTNRYIWENESKARAGAGSQDHLLKLTHSINGVRNAAKNALSRAIGESRVDHKLDCFAADLVAEFGNWNVVDS